MEEIANALSSPPEVVDGEPDAIMADIDAQVLGGKPAGDVKLEDLFADVSDDEFPGAREIKSTTQSPASSPEAAPSPQ